MESKLTVDMRKQIIARAIVDPAFRRHLLTKPEEVFLDEKKQPMKMTEADRAAIKRLEKFLPGLDTIVTNLAGEVLCGGGGGCGGLA
jgi:hypothetical protein